MKVKAFELDGNDLIDDGGPRYRRVITVEDEACDCCVLVLFDEGSQTYSRNFPVDVVGNISDRKRDQQTKAARVQEHASR